LDKKLFFAIEKAEIELDEAADFEQAILDLSTRKTATLVLTMALRDAVVNAENIWQAIEKLPEFKACYSDRKQAREDYLRIYFDKGAKVW